MSLWITHVDDDETLLAEVPGGVLVRILESTHTLAHVDHKMTTSLVFVPGVHLDVDSSGQYPTAVIRGGAR